MDHPFSLLHGSMIRVEEDLRDIDRFFYIHGLIRSVVYCILMAILPIWYSIVTYLLITTLLSYLIIADIPTLAFNYACAVVSDLQESVVQGIQLMKWFWNMSGTLFLCLQWIILYKNFDISPEKIVSSVLGVVVVIQRAYRQFKVWIFNIMGLHESSVEAGSVRCWRMADLMSKLVSKDKPTEDCRLQCVVCLEMEKCVLVFPCRHLVMCLRCSFSVGKHCPVCRKIIESTTKVYL